MGGREVSEGSDRGGGGGGRAVLRGTAAWVWGSAKPFSTPIQSGKVQMGPGRWPGSCLALRLVYTQGSSWNRGQHTPGGMLSAVLWSVAPLGGLPLLRPLCREGEGRDSPSLTDATQRGSGHPLLPTGILRSLHRCSPQAPRPWGQASGSLSHPHPRMPSAPSMTVPPMSARWATCPLPQLGHSRGSERGAKQQGGPDSVELGQRQLPVLGRDPWRGLRLHPGQGPQEQLSAPPGGLFRLPSQAVGSASHL